MEPTDAFFMTIVKIVLITTRNFHSTLSDLRIICNRLVGFNTETIYFSLVRLWASYSNISFIHILFHHMQKDKKAKDPLFHHFIYYVFSNSFGI